MSGLHKTLFIFAGGLFCLLLVRVAERPASGKTAPIGLAMVADRANFAPESRNDKPRNGEALRNELLRDESPFVADFSRVLANPKLSALPWRAPSPTSRLPSPYPTPNPSNPSNPPDAAAPAKYHEVWAVVTAYCPCARCCGARAHGRTSLGNTAWVSGIAADPRALPYGTRLAVPGYGEAVVDDTGGAMRRHWDRRGEIHVDVRMKWHHEARDWGRKWMKIRIYDE
ncbi:MAG: 3D domain-containing protein [Planctomycetota bacterium]|jgi:3D (Asp-Asp-Asp) domain-containing protein|nr:3D domain-containing protein [Planctomycetota bacterium]